MIEPDVTAVPMNQQPSRITGSGVMVDGFGSLMVSATQATVVAGKRMSVWAANTAQQFGVLVAVLMGPAVFACYAFAIWALAANVGWTDSFVFSAGALSNWLIWLGVALLVNMAATILKKHTLTE